MNQWDVHLELRNTDLDPDTGGWKFLRKFPTPPSSPALAIPIVDSLANQLSTKLNGETSKASKLPSLTKDGTYKKTINNK